jgi:type III secretion protein V
MVLPFISSLTGAAGKFPRSPISFITRHPDIILAILVVSMLGMMIVPLPTFILDLFLTINISFAMTLLVSSLYIPDAIGIASFPTLLLLTTLFRLSLNVSSTRLILLNGYAGEVINSFGRFVVKGNYIVGGVIFLILTLIQFIVIAKGSERVAEVSARFNLDSMPGKQMSIDADLRNGAISMEEAKKLRRELERENQFYGAMDGAMKFVKGDAIAGIVITAINIIGGLAIGVIQKGLSLDIALKKYTVLTIGDGLVSQIPSIVISTAAGIVVTRVASQEQESNIGREIGIQLTKYPIALIIVSSLLIILSILPGLPKIPFLLMGCAIALGGYKLLKSEKTLEENNTREEKRIIPGLIQPLSIYATSQMIKDRAEFEKGIRYIEEEVFFKLGIQLPEPAIFINDEKEDSFIIKIYENTVISLALPENCVLAAESPEILSNYGIASESSFILYGMEYSFIKEEHGENLKKLGVSIFEKEKIILFILRETLFKTSEKFIGINEVQLMLDGVSTFYPALVREVVPGLIAVPQLTELLRRLLQEGIPIRNLRLILESIAKNSQHEKNIALLTELVRTDMKTEICHVLGNGKKELHAFILSPFLESQLMDSITGSNGDMTLSIDPEFASNIFESVEQNCRASETKRRIIIITQPELRLLFRNFITRKFSNIIVVSYNEIDPEFAVHPIGEIGTPEG